MSRWGIRIAPLFAAAALLVFAGLLSSCGGSDSSSGSTAPETSAEAEAEAKPGSQGGSESGSGKSQSAEAKGGEGGGKSSGSTPVAPLKVSGGGSGQFRVKGGDNSIQDFGEESDEGELEEAARALHDFYVARAEEDWKTACSNLAKMVVGQLEQLGARSKSGDKSCPATLAAITPPLPPAVQRETTVVDAGSLRVEGDRGFLIYRGAEKTVYAINMAREGAWKVGALAGVPLS